MPMNLKFSKMLILVLLISSCSINQSNKEAVRIIDNKVRFYFHAQLNAEQYQQIIDQSDNEFKNSVGELKAREYLSAVRAKLGKIEGTVLKNWTANNENNRTLIAVIYETKFERDNAREEFIGRVEGGKAFLFRYNLDSRTLVIK
jgi:hypothetical protein